MTLFEELCSVEVDELRDRYFELYGVNCGYHWNNYGSVAEYVAHLKKKIAEKEKESAIDPPPKYR